MASNGPDPSTSGSDGEPETGDGVDGVIAESPDSIELFFDLVFVFAFTRITAFVARDHTWAGVARALALLAALWWAWVTFTWLMDTTSLEAAPPRRVVVLAASAVMFVAAIAVPDAFGETAVVFGVAYFAVRALHVGLTVGTTGGEARARFLHLVPGFLGGPALLLAAAFVASPLREALWVTGIAVDYGALYVGGVARFDVSVTHFVERYRDIVVIALGESVLAMGFAVARSDPGLPPRVIVAGLLGIGLVAALSWLYFDYVTQAAEEYLGDVGEYERGTTARDSYAYLHFPIVAGVVFVAFGLEETVAHPTEPLGTIAAVSLYGGCTLYLLGHSAFRLADVGSVSVARLVVAAVAAAAVPLVLRVPALHALAGVTVLLVGLAAFETAYSSIRHSVREE